MAPYLFTNLRPLLVALGLAAGTLIAIAASVGLVMLQA